MEWRFFDDETAWVSTAKFHEDRPRAPHLEQPIHRNRLFQAAAYVHTAARMIGSTATVSDLGCGDGGLLSLVQDHVADAWGYDFQPSNQEGWIERSVNAQSLDVFDADHDKVNFGDITVVTEVLEHLTNPHAAVQWIGKNSRFIVASSPWDEGPWHRDPCHAWAFDQAGYQALIEQGGYRIIGQVKVHRFQVVLGMQL